MEWGLQLGQQYAKAAGLPVGLNLVGQRAHLVFRMWFSGLNLKRTLPEEEAGERGRGRRERGGR